MKTERNIKLTLEYDGAAYVGWQRQPTGTSIQGTLEEAIASLTGRTASLRGSGRTDAGVHAFGQAASFKTTSTLGADTIKRALNALLPPDIRVTEAAEVPGDFHARFGAVRKCYVYHISDSPELPVFLGRYVWRTGARLNAGAMRRAARHFTGRRDFSALMAAGSGTKDPVRELHSLAVSRTRGFRFLSASLQGSLITVTAEADGFLRHMVRNIAGTLVEVGKGKLVPDDIVRLLESCDRSLAGPTAPAHGLFLKEVVYPPCPLQPPCPPV